MQHSTACKIQVWGLLVQDINNEILDKINPMHTAFDTCEKFMKMPSPKMA